MKRIEIEEVGNKIEILIKRNHVTEKYKYNKHDLYEMLKQIKYQLGTMECSYLHTHGTSMLNTDIEF